MFRYIEFIPFIDKTINQRHYKEYFHWAITETIRAKDSKIYTRREQISHVINKLIDIQSNLLVPN